MLTMQYNILVHILQYFMLLVCVLYFVLYCICSPTSTAGMTDADWSGRKGALQFESRFESGNLQQARRVSVYQLRYFLFKINNHHFHSNRSPLHNRYSLPVDTIPLSIRISLMRFSDRYYLSNVRVLSYGTMATFAMYALVCKKSI